MFTVQKRQVFQFSAKTKNKKKNVRLNTHTELHKGAYSHRYTIKLDTLPFANTRVFMHAPAHTHTHSYE